MRISPERNTSMQLDHSVLDNVSLQGFRWNGCFDICSLDVCMYMLSSHALLFSSSWNSGSAMELAAWSSIDIAFMKPCICEVIDFVKVETVVSDSVAFLNKHSGTIVHARECMCDVILGTIIWE